MEKTVEHEQDRLVTPELDLALTGSNWESVTAELNKILGGWLAEMLTGAGDFGQQLAMANEVVQIDYYLDDDLIREQEDKAKTALGDLNSKLTYELRRILTNPETYKVPPHQAERTFVRRWGVNFGAEGTAGCKYYEYKNNVYQEYCYRACSTC